MTGSNRRPSACKADALPAELIAHISGDPTGIRTRDTAVKGRCLNRLTMGPKTNLTDYTIIYQNLFQSFALRCLSRLQDEIEDFCFATFDLPTKTSFGVRIKKPLDHGAKQNRAQDTIII